MKYKLVKGPQPGFCYGCILWEAHRTAECKIFNIHKSCHDNNWVWVIANLQLNKNITIL